MKEVTVATMNPNNDSAKKSNKDLTPQERKAKRALKRQLKVQQKRARLETRLRHAMKRNDSAIEAETRQALRALNEDEAPDSGEIKPLEETPEREFVMRICSELQRKQHQVGNRETKQAQTEQAVSLLRHMTKGMQARDMFQDSNALWGYARQKFFQRAMLVCSSFLKMRPTEGVDDNDHCMTVWHQLRSVRRICSIGCGPGNDAIGVVAFLKAIDENAPQLERAVLLDWAMNDWKLVVEPLCEIVVPEYVRTVDISSCDVSDSLLEGDSNRTAKDLIVDEGSSANVDLFLISYLLTETRGQWGAFVNEMIHVSRPNTLFYFAEPTPWQLHLVKDSFRDALDFFWLDSSMNKPELQPLDNRVGPGVLLGRKRANDL